MKNIVILFTAIIVITITSSCGNNNAKKGTTLHHSCVTKKDTVYVLTDSMVSELKMAYKRSMELYSDEQFYKYVEYIYPHLFKYLKNKSHNTSIEAEKSKYIDMLITRNENFWEKTVPIISTNATSYSFAFKGIEFFCNSDCNLCVIFKRQAFCNTKNGIMKSPDFSYEYAIYLAKYSKWYFLDFATKDIAEILKEDFNQKAINEITEKTNSLQ